MEAGPADLGGPVVGPRNAPLGRGLIVGLAGHIDHGKTSLVRALSGIDTDRLPEEKSRGITLDLGFAYVPLAGGGVLGFVDVPGHERLVHTMIAGATSIGMALLVVAADDGVMPQTREHLHVLSLLGITRAVVALTKTDLVDPDRALEVELDVTALLDDTRLAGAAVFPVSTVTGVGIDALRLCLMEVAMTRSDGGEDGRLFRLAVDRCFSLAGAGTVVTGSVASGSVGVGESVVVLPGEIRARVRGIQVAGRPVEVAWAGDRCALNLAGPGVRRDAIGRGDWVSAPDGTAMSRRCDIEMTLLAEGMKTGTPLLVHHGAGQASARAVLLESSAPDVGGTRSTRITPPRIDPGRIALARIILDRAMPLRHGDRLVLRDVSASRTIAGGRVLDPSPPLRGGRRPERLAVLHALRGQAALTDWLTAVRLVRRDVLLGDWGLRSPPPDTEAIGGWLATAAGIEALTRAVTEALTILHARQPAAPGASTEALRLAMPERLSREAIGALLDHLAGRGVVVAEGHMVRLPSHRGVLSGPEARWWASLRPVLETGWFRPPLLREAAAAIDAPEIALRRACKGFARLGMVVEMAPDRFFISEAAAQLTEAARALSAEVAGGWFTAAQFRDRVGTGRQLAIQVLDYLDRRGVTVRRGDLRRAGGELTRP